MMDLLEDFSDDDLEDLSVSGGMVVAVGSEGNKEAARMEVSEKAPPASKPSPASSPKGPADASFEGDEVMAFEDDFESDDSDDEWQKRRAKEVAERKKRHEEEQQRRREKEKANAAASGISPADQRKYIKAFAKWAEGERGLSVENVPDLLAQLRPKKLALSLSDEELRRLLQNMGVPEDHIPEPQPGEEWFITQDDFLRGMGTRQEVCGR